MSPNHERYSYGGGGRSSASQRHKRLLQALESNTRYCLFTCLLYEHLYVRVRKRVHVAGWGGVVATDVLAVCVRVSIPKCLCETCRHLLAGMCDTYMNVVLCVSLTLIMRCAPMRCVGYMLLFAGPLPKMDNTVVLGMSRDHPLRKSIYKLARVIALSLSLLSSFCLLCISLLLFIHCFVLEAAVYTPSHVGCSHSCVCGHVGRVVVYFVLLCR